MGIKKSKRLIWMIVAIVALSNPASGDTLFRQFHLELPLFTIDGPWNQNIESAMVIPDNDHQILTLYRVLRGDVSHQYPRTKTPITTWPFMDINYDDYSIPIFQAGRKTQAVILKDYQGVPSMNTDKLPTGSNGMINTPACLSAVRPAGPRGSDADGHMVLYDQMTHKAYDFWQASTAKGVSGNSLGGGQRGDKVLEAGAIDVFDTQGPGVNPKGNSSARATGVPLLAGLILPEDFEKGEIAHALAVAIPGLRNTNSSDPSEPWNKDYFYPTSTTETDFYSRNRYAPAAGQRLRLKRAIIDDSGGVLDEAMFSPATRLFLTALRKFGAIIVDNAGGFSFYAEDIHTGNLNLTQDQINYLIGKASRSPLAKDKSKWQIVMEKINQELETIPFAFGPWQKSQKASKARITRANFEFIAMAEDP